MKRNFIFLLILIALYLVPSLILDAVYGPSFMLWSGTDYWRPDGQGGWVEVGEPTDPKPVEPSVNVPILMHYIPLLLPGLVLMVVLLTPLTRLLEDPRPKPDQKDPPEGMAGKGTPEDGNDSNGKDSAPPERPG